jgi:hypothetical protein
MAPNWTHLIRFIAEEDGREHLGQVNARTYPDVGLSVEKGEKITVKLVQGCIFDGTVTERTMTVKHVSYHTADATGVKFCNEED